MDFMKSITWLHTGFIGDLVLLSAALDAVEQLLPDSRQTLVTNPAGGAVFDGDTRLKQTIVVNKRKDSVWELRRKLRSLTVDAKDQTFIQVHGSVRSSLLLLGQSGTRITYEETPLAWGAAKKPRVAVLPEHQRVLVLLEALGLSREKLFAFKPRLQTWALVPEAMQTVLKGPRKLFGLAPGSVWGTKRWPKEYFAILAQKIIAHSDMDVVLMGAHNERELCRDVEVQLQSLQVADKRIHNWAGKTSIQEMRAVIPQFSMILANDSAPLHFASAFNIPTLAFFGATVPGMGFGPVADRALILENEALACRPCSIHGPPRCPLGHFQCMMAVTPDKIWPKVLEFMVRLNLS